MPARGELAAPRPQPLTAPAPCAAGVNAPMQPQPPSSKMPKPPSSKKPSSSGSGGKKENVRPQYHGLATQEGSATARPSSKYRRAKASAGGSHSARAATRALPVPTAHTRAHSTSAERFSRHGQRPPGQSRAAAKRRVRTWLGLTRGRCARARRATRSAAADQPPQTPGAHHTTERGQDVPGPAVQLRAVGGAGLPADLLRRDGRAEDPEHERQQAQPRLRRRARRLLDGHARPHRLPVRGDRGARQGLLRAGGQGVRLQDPDGVRAQDHPQQEALPPAGPH